MVGRFPASVPDSVPPTPLPALSSACRSQVPPSPGAVMLPRTPSSPDVRIPENPAASTISRRFGLPESTAGHRAFRLSLRRHASSPLPSNLKQCTQFHAKMIVNGSFSPPSIDNLVEFLVDPHRGDFDYGLLVFRQIQHASVFLWNIVIRSASRNGDPGVSIGLYREFRVNGLSPDSHTFSNLFKACSQLLDARFGKRGHGEAIRLGFEWDTFVGDSLIHMYSAFELVDDAKRVFDRMSGKTVASWTSLVGVYAKVGMVGCATKLFDEMPDRNVVSFTTMVRGYFECGREAEAMNCLKEMISIGIKPDTVALVSLLSMCARLKMLELGRWAHQFISKEGFQSDDHLAIAMVDMYSKCGDLGAARRIYDEMPKKNVLASNSLIDGYCKNGKVEAALALFNEMPMNDLVSFNSMIMGCVQSGKFKEAWMLFSELLTSHIKPDSFTMVSLLSACPSIATLENGRFVHSFVVVNSIDQDVFLATSLLDMYAKCGRIDEAIYVFNSMNKKDVLAWTAMISGLATHGRARSALDRFVEMQSAGLKPNDVTLVAVLSACSHGGLDKEGMLHFKRMKDVYLLTPKVEHYGCVVDLLGRTGRLDDAIDVIENMPMEPNATIWASLLAACRIHKNADLAERAVRELLALEPEKDAAYVVLYSIYASLGRWDDASKIRERMENAGISKASGCSSIMVHGVIHEFIAGSKSHPQYEQIQPMIDGLLTQLINAGYIPITSDFLLSINLEDEELSFSYQEHF